MEINFELITNDIGLPEILLSASTNFGDILIPANINNLIKIIPIDLLVEYKTIAKNKISDMIQNDEIMFIGNYVENVDSITKYLDLLEEG